MANFITVVDYINCSTSTKEEIARINAVIAKLQDAELNAAAYADIEEYRLDDGQTVIKTIYRDISSISKAIEVLERRKQRAINKCVGYRYNLQDGNVKLC